MSAADVIFLGPSLARAEAHALLSADYRPPARRGDVLRAAQQGARRIGLIDGHFCEAPAVSHMEILAALRGGVSMFGASSMGALRAAELSGFGMIGVGRIFADFLCGALSDDDEVALQHGPAELGFPALSESMVNVRASVAVAADLGVLEGAAGRVLDAAKALHYPERTWPQIVSGAAGLGGDGAELARFQAWLPEGRIDQKRLDAIALLVLMANSGRPFPPHPVPAHTTAALAALARDLMAPPAPPG